MQYIYIYTLTSPVVDDPQDKQNISYQKDPFHFIFGFILKGKNIYNSINIMATSTKQTYMDLNTQKALKKITDILH